MAQRNRLFQALAAQATLTGSIHCWFWFFDAICWQQYKYIRFPDLSFKMNLNRSCDVLFLTLNMSLPLVEISMFYIYCSSYFNYPLRNVLINAPFNITSTQSQVKCWGIVWQRVRREDWCQSHISLLFYLSTNARNGGKQLWWLCAKVTKSACQHLQSSLNRPVTSWSLPFVFIPLRINVNDNDDNCTPCTFKSWYFLRWSLCCENLHCPLEGGINLLD